MNLQNLSLLRTIRALRRLVDKCTLARVPKFGMLVLVAALSESLHAEKESVIFDSDLAAQSSWYKTLDSFSGQWIDVDGTFVAAIDGQRFSLDSKGVWPELKGPILLSPQMDFLAGNCLYELQLGVHPEQWILLLKYPTDGNAGMPDFRVFQRKKEPQGEPVEDSSIEVLFRDPNIGWRLKLLMLSGRWISVNSADAEMVLEYRKVSFVRAESWPELAGVNYLAGSTRSFQIGDFRFDIKYRYQGRDEIVIFRKNLTDSSISSLTFNRIKD